MSFSFNMLLARDEVCRLTDNSTLDFFVLVFEQLDILRVNSVPTRYHRALLIIKDSKLLHSIIDFPPNFGVFSMVTCIVFSEVCQVSRLFFNMYSSHITSPFSTVGEVS